MSSKQISGAFSLDLSGLAEQLAEQLRPDFTYLGDQIRQVRRSEYPEVLTWVEAVPVLMSAGWVSAEVGALIEDLHSKGYALVRLPEVPSQTPAPASPPADDTAWIETGE